MDEKINAVKTEPVKITKKKIYKRMWFWIIILVIIAIALLPVIIFNRGNDSINESNKEETQVVYRNPEDVIRAYVGMVNNGYKEKVKTLLHSKTKLVMTGFENIVDAVKESNMLEDKNVHVYCTYDSINIVSNESLAKLKNNYSTNTIEQQAEKEVLKILNEEKTIYECRIIFESVLDWLETYFYVVEENEEYKIFAYSTMLSNENIIKNAKELKYLDFARNPLKHKGEKVKFTGEVVQALYTENNAFIILSITKDEWGYYSDEICAVYRGEAGEDKILEGDIITLYGTITGEYSYTGLLNNPVTLPMVCAVKAEIKN